MIVRYALRVLASIFVLLFESPSTLSAQPSFLALEVLYNTYGNVFTGAARVQYSLGARV